MRYWAKIGIGLISCVVAMALVPALAASAGSTKSTKGTDPHSSVCKAYVNLKKSTDKPGSPATKVNKAMSTGDWTAAKSDLEGAGTALTSAIEKLDSTLKHAPKKVKSAGEVQDTYATKLMTIVHKADGIKDFNSLIDSLQIKGSLPEAQKTLAAYAIKLCGSSIAK